MLSTIFKCYSLYHVTPTEGTEKKTREMCMDTHGERDSQVLPSTWVPGSLWEDSSYHCDLGLSVT